MGNTPHSLSSERWVVHSWFALSEDPGDEATQFTMHAPGQHDMMQSLDLRMPGVFADLLFGSCMRATSHG